ncbi:V-type H+-transporting ATPase subunit d [Nematocida displodere]|uniref:V-type H+-transporting ATPase subunit d n=1 Tax=Nematocida displodere TaxID=1805483 RepID=A0A177EGM2_9MICR|nr:V-type H+-transporting ATPase subunit d [Nematocida displodere]
MHEDAGIISYVHGNKDRLMKIEDYRSIKACNTIEDLKVKLQHSGYGKELLEEPLATPKAFKNALYRCLLEEVSHTLSFSTSTSQKLVEFYRESFQLNNFIYLWACKRENPKNLELPIDTNPLGNYDGLSFIKVTQGSEDTWKFCLENTPLQKYIGGLSHEILNGDIQYITNILKKQYLERLYRFSVDNQLCLVELVQFESDKQIIEILHSTIGSSITPKSKMELFPTCGTFNHMQSLLLISCKSLDELKGALSTHRTYRNIVGSEIGVEDALRREEIRICKSFFVYYDDPSIVYTQFKLQEIEISNLIFLSECITQGRIENIDEVLDMDDS